MEEERHDHGQRDDAEHADQAEFEAHQGVSSDRADKTERNRGHDDERLQVALERDGQQPEDDEHREPKVLAQARKRLSLRALFADKLRGQPGKLRLLLWEYLGVERIEDFLRRDDPCRKLS